jgi:hypothetical protein
MAAVVSSFRVGLVGDDERSPLLAQRSRSAACVALDAVFTSLSIVVVFTYTRLRINSELRSIRELFVIVTNTLEAGARGQGRTLERFSVCSLPRSYLI